MKPPCHRRLWYIQGQNTAGLHACKNWNDMLVAQAVLLLPATGNGTLCQGSITALLLYLDTLTKMTTTGSVGGRIFRYMDNFAVWCGTAILLSHNMYVWNVDGNFLISSKDCIWHICSPLFSFPKCLLKAIINFSNRLYKCLRVLIALCVKLLPFSLWIGH